jgi:hypothetical protein
MNIETNPKGMIFNTMRQYIAYADDVLIFGQSVKVTEEFVIQFKEGPRSTGLVINESKMNYMKIKQKYKIFTARSGKRWTGI